jgi:hypothetical protein
MPDFEFDPALNSLAVNTAGVESLARYHRRHWGCYSPCYWCCQHPRLPRCRCGCYSRRCCHHRHCCHCRRYCCCWCLRSAAATALATAVSAAVVLLLLLSSLPPQLLPHSCFCCRGHRRRTCCGHRRRHCSRPLTAATAYRRTGCRSAPG